MRILVDGRITGMDGIGRYTRCVTAALTAEQKPAVRIEVLGPTGTARYSREEGEELLRAAARFRADVIHALDYRIPVTDSDYAVVSTVHDVLRLDSRSCYDDDQFEQRFGRDGLARLHTLLEDLRARTAPSPRDAPEVVSAHAEFYGRMLQWTLMRSRHVIVPTASVAGQCAVALHPAAGRLTVSPWGVDHDRYDPAFDPSNTEAARPDTGGRYLLYVGQTRSHKQLPALVSAYLNSHAPEAGVDLVCAGTDFASGTATSAWLAALLGPRSRPVGAVPDGQLRALYRGAEALVHTAEHEGFGFTPLEALAHGTRVIAGDIPVLRETLGSHAQFVDIHDEKDIAAAINSALAASDDEPTRSDRRRWASRYRWFRHAKDLLHLYEQACT